MRVTCTVPEPVIAPAAPALFITTVAAGVNKVLTPFIFIVPAMLKLALDEIRMACKGETNIMPLIINAAKTYATLGEIVAAMKDVFGEWQESSIF